MTRQTVLGLFFLLIGVGIIASALSPAGARSMTSGAPTFPPTTPDDTRSP